MFVLRSGRSLGVCQREAVKARSSVGRLFFFEVREGRLRKVVVRKGRGGQLDVREEVVPKRSFKM